MIEEVQKRPNCIIKTYQDSAGHDVFMIGGNFGRAIGANERHTTFQIQLSQIFEDMNINIKKKFIETFSNGVVVYSLYADKKCCKEEFDAIIQLSNDLFNIPDTIFRKMLINK